MYPFELSISVALADGPKANRPSFSKASARPAANDASGPMTTRSIRSFCAKATRPSTSVAWIGTQIASSAIPALPGAQ